MAGLPKLTWREYKRVSTFRKQRGAGATKGTVESSVVVAELVGTVLWMAWELDRGGRAGGTAATKRVPVAAEEATTE